MLQKLVLGLRRCVKCHLHPPGVGLLGDPGGEADELKEEWEAGKASLGGLGENPRQRRSLQGGAGVCQVDWGIVDSGGGPCRGLHA